MDHTSHWQVWDGFIDDVSMFNVALSAEQIDYILDLGISGSEDNLVGAWDFNEGQGSTLTDLSGNGNNGTIYGATWSDDVYIVSQSTSSEDIFFSEWAEGSSNNKYLELYDECIYEIVSP